MALNSQWCKDWEIHLWHKGHRMSINPVAVGAHNELLPHKPGESIRDQGEVCKIVVSTEMNYLQSYSQRKNSNTFVPGHKKATWGLSFAVSCCRAQAEAEHWWVPLLYLDKLSRKGTKWAPRALHPLLVRRVGWNKLLAALHTIWARFFSRPMICSLLWLYFPRLVIRSHHGKGWDSTGEPDSTHACSSDWEVNCEMIESTGHGVLFFSDETEWQSSYCISKGGEI